MPLEIRELTINVSVNQPGTADEQTQSDNESNDKNKNREIIKECIEQIMKIINDKKER